MGDTFDESIIVNKRNKNSRKKLQIKILEKNYKRNQKIIRSLKSIRYCISITHEHAMYCKTEKGKNLKIH